MCIPARMLNEYVYCPRLSYIEWVQGEFEKSADTVEGRTDHRRVDEERGSLPGPESGERIHAASVWMSAPGERMTAKIDLVEGEGGVVRPVDYKHGSAPDNPYGAWDPDRVQLCAQGLILRENGYECPGGVIYYCSSKTRVDVPFDDELVELTRRMAAEAIAMAEGGAIPPPLQNSPKCPRCSLAGICLPDETLYLSGAGLTHAEDEKVRRLVPARDDALPMYVTGQGDRLVKNGEVFEVLSGNAKTGEARIAEVSHIGVFGSVHVTTPALSECFARGIPVLFFSMGGWFKGIAHGMAHKNVELRWAQYEAARDAVRSLEFSRRFVSAKILNARTLLLRNHPDPPQEAVRMMARMAGAARKAEDKERLLGLEGNGARAYFGNFAGMIKVQDGSGKWAFDFEGRNRRPPRDPVNALL
ncbi:MAG: CRISPR-associated endonuclease Cas1, partial [Bacteroidota bacterium]|nr:CRISPR-associated endonuclease Cas1 [Bacteroidota bacterium]